MGIDMLLQRALSRGWNLGNLCPAIYGAFQIGIEMPQGCKSHRVPVPNGLVCVLFVPDAQPEGAPLSQQPVERKAAIFNVGRMALLVNCFCSNNFAMFGKATEDTLMQPHVSSQFPYVQHVVQAAIDAGASGAVAAGYGPSVMALITGRSGDIMAQSSFNELERAVAKAMLSRADVDGVPGQIFITKPSDVGAHVLAEKSDLCANLGTDRIVYFQ
jgi:homoserine kinase